MTTHTSRRDHPTSNRARVTGRTSKSFQPDKVYLLYDRHNSQAWITCEEPADLEANR